MNDESYDTNDDGVKLHLRESEALRKQWVTYVFDAVQKLHEKVAENSLQVQKEREEFFHKLVDLKEKLEEQLKDASKEQALELKKIDEKLANFIQEVSGKFTTVADNMDGALNKQVGINNEATAELRDYVDAQLKVINTNMEKIVISQTSVRAQLGVYVTLVVLGTTTILGVLASSVLIIFKDSLKAWLG